VFTLDSHGFSPGTYIELATTGSLPTGLVASGFYYVLAQGLTTNTFQVSLTNGGVPVNTSGSQSGTQSLAVWTPSNADVVSAIEWNSIQSISPGTGVPNTVFYDPQYPNGVVNVAPIPSANTFMFLNAWYPFNSFSTLSTQYNFATGIDEALALMLALAIKPYFKSAVIDQDLMERIYAAKTFISLRTLNTRAMQIRQAASPQRHTAQG
jgi:hypothetical protein